MNVQGQIAAARFVEGQAVDCNGFRGTIVKILSGELTGMANVRVPGGVTNASLSCVIPLPDDPSSELVAGALVYGDWGAMLPRWDGRILEVGEKDCLIEWEEYCKSEPSRHAVQTEPPSSGSPVGVYIDRRRMIYVATRFDYPLPDGCADAVLKALQEHGKAVIGGWWFSVDGDWIWGTDAYGVDYVAAQEVSAAGVEKVLASVTRQEESNEPHPAEHSY